MPVPSLPNGPGWTYAQAGVKDDVLLQKSVPQGSTTITGASNGVLARSFQGSGTLNVASTSGYPTTGTIYVDTSTGPGAATITYAGITGTTFGGCLLVSGTGTLQTGGNVAGVAVNTYFTQSQYCSVQLADGTGVTLFSWGSYYYLLGTVLGKTGYEVFASEGLPAATPAGSFCLAVDSSDNLYVCFGYEAFEMFLWKWIRQTGSNNAWTKASPSSQPIGSTNADAEHTPMNMVWVDDGATDGTLIVATEYSVVTFSADTLALVNSYTPGNTPCAAAVCAAGLGISSGLLVQGGYLTTQEVFAFGWSSSSGVLTFSSRTTIDDSSLSLPVDDVRFAPHVRFAGDSTWFVMYPDIAGNLIGQAVYSSSGGNPVADVDGPVPAPSLTGVAHYVPSGRGSEVGSYAEYQFIDNVGGSQSDLVWVVTRTPGLPSVLLRQNVKITTGSSPNATWGLVAFQVASGMDTSSTSVVCPGEPQVSQVDVVVGSVPGAVNTFALSGTSVQPPYQPAAPLLTGPNYRAVNDPTGSTPFEFTVDPEEAQAQFVLVTTPWGGGSSQYWTGSEWTQFEFRITASIPAGGSPVSPPTVGSGQFVGNGSAYGWQIYTWDAAGTCSQAPFPFKIIFAIPPSASLAVDSDTTSLPTISWTYTPGETGGLQASYRVLIGVHGWNPVSGTPVADSGTIAGPGTSWTVQAATDLSGPTVISDYLENGLEYDAYVFVTDVFGATNGPLTGATPVSWTIGYSALTAPTLSATAPSDGSAVVLAASGNSGNVMEFQYSYDGVNWLGDVRFGEACPVVSGVAHLDDYDMVGNSTLGLFKTAIYYQARQIDVAAAQVSAWSTTEHVSIPAWVGYFWLKDPLDSDLNAQVQVMPPWDIPIEILAASYQELGSGFDVVVSDGQRGPAGPMTFITQDPSDAFDSDMAALLALLLPATNGNGTARVLLLQTPYGDSYYMTFITSDDIATQFSPADLPYRLTKVSYVGVARP